MVWEGSVMVGGWRGRQVSIMGNVLKAMKDIKSGVTSIVVCKVVDVKPRKCS